MSAIGTKGWTPDLLPDLSGRAYVISGGNSGIGYEAARMLGANGAAVTILCRNEEKAANAIEALKAAAPRGAYDAVPLDLESLTSVADAATALRKRHDKIDGLINNAGIMMPPRRQLTKDGFELQIGVNHFGHFALNAALCDLVEAAQGRFVSVASIAHKFAPGIRWDDIHFERGYSPTRAYAQSKLANLIYARDLNRRLTDGGLNARAYACHPGYSATNLQTTGPGAIMGLLIKPMTAIFSQSAEKGAYPSVLCAAGAEAEPGGYYGPTRNGEMVGPVRDAKVARPARDIAAGERLFDLTRDAVGAHWSIFGDV